MDRWETNEGHVIVVGVLAAILIAGCAGSPIYTPVSPAAADEQLAALAELGYPMDLLRTVSADGERFCCGADFAAELPDQHITAQGTQLLLEPSWDESGEPSQDDLAYAMYVFCLDGYDDQPELAMHWDTAPADWNSCFVGLGNQLHNRWDWFTGDDLSGGLLILQNLSPYLDGDGDLVMIVLMTGTDSCMLSWLRWGANLEPTAVLDADPTIGSIPLEVNFDAGSSTDLDGTIDNYEWDFNGNDNFGESGDEAAAAGSATASHMYTTAGEYVAAVRVTDNLGAEHTTTVDLAVYSGGYWVIVDLTDHDGETSLAVIDGCPAICFSDVFSYSGVYYLKASTATGTSAADWSMPVQVAAAATRGALIEAAGHPAIKYSLNEPDRLMYTRATTAAGTAAVDWNEDVLVDFGYFDGILAVVDGHPAFGLSIGHSLYYMRATTPTGADSTDWGDPFEIYTGS